jgi:L-malate glycosyltransferase
MKILVISHEYPPIGGGGGRVIQDLCEGIASEEYKFHILTAQLENLSAFEQYDNLTLERIKSHRTMAYRAGLVTMTCFVWKSFWRALNIIKNWKPDIIHAHFAVPGGASAALAGIITKTPYIITAHGGDVPGGAPGKTRNWFRFLLPFTHFIWKNAAKIITVSQRSRQLAQNQYPVEIEIIPNGINMPNHPTINLKPQNPPCIIYIGRFSPEKNAQAVPKILSHLLDLPWKCIMVGDGSQKDLILKLIIKNNLKNRIDLLGWLDPDEVDRVLIGCDILLMPSYQEGMPMVGLQALAAGTALIMSAVGACLDMVDNGKNGFLIEPGDIEGYAGALRQLLEDTPLLHDYKIKSSEKAKSFDIKEVVCAYKNVYLSIVNGEK